MLTTNALPSHRSCRPSSVAGTRHVSGVLAALTLLPLPACTTEHVTAVDALSVRVEPAGWSAIEGEHHTFSAVVVHGDGVLVPGAEVDWSSDNPAVAVVDENGSVEALGEGLVEIRATFRYAARGSARVHVLPARKVLAHWRLDDAAGDTAGDSARETDNPGTLVGDTPPEWIAGQVNGALRFAGGNRVEITGSADHSHWHFAVQNKSVSFWFRWRPADAVGAGYMIGKFQGGKPGSGWHFAVDGEDKLTFNHRRSDGGSRRVTSTTAIHAETWYHVVFTLTDRGLANFYLNGALEDTNVSFNDLNNNINKTVGIGAARGDTSNNTFGGDIDDVRFHAHPLSQQEVDVLYRCGLAGAC